MPTQARIVRHARLQVARLAHIQYFAAIAEHAIDTGPTGQSFQIVLDDVNAAKRGCTIILRFHESTDSACVACLRGLEQFPHQKIDIQAGIKGHADTE